MFDLKTLIKKFSLHIPQTDVELLVAHAINKPREFLFSHLEYHLSPIAYFKFRYYLWLRSRDFSVAAITHHKEFFGLDFFVNKHTLIPRPETELLAENTVDEIQKHRNTEIMLIDVGTGSGCIPIAINKSIFKPSPLRGGTEGGVFKTIAIDISRRALKVAKRNAKTHNVAITFLKGNLLEPFVKNYKLLPTSYQLVITANLPYLTQEQFDSEPSIQKEPHSALVAPNNGLALYEELLTQIQSFLQANSYKLQAFLEIDPSQTSAIKQIVQKYLPSATVKIKKDLAGNDRVVKITL